MLRALLPGIITLRFTNTNIQNEHFRINNLVNSGDALVFQLCGELLFFNEACRFSAYALNIFFDSSFELSIFTKQ